MDPLEILYLQPFHFPADHAHGIQIIATCGALARTGARVTLPLKRTPTHPVVSPDDGLAHYGATPQPGLELSWLPTGPFGIDSLAMRWRVLRAGRGSIFYARHLRLADLAARTGRGTVLLELHTLEGVQRELLERVDGIVATSSALADELTRRFEPSTAVRIIPNGVDLDHFSVPTQTADTPRAVYFGSLEPRKGVERLIAALAQTRDLEALIIGGTAGDREPLLQCAREHKVESRIAWHDRVAPSQLCKLLRQRDIGVIPSRAQSDQEFGGTPLKLLEWMACGLPVIASDLEAITAVLSDDHNGRLFPVDDSDALGRRLDELASDPELARRLGTAGRETALACSWDARAERILDFICELRD